MTGWRHGRLRPSAMPIEAAIGPMPSFSSASCWPCGCRRLKPGLAEDLAAAPMPRRPASRPAFRPPRSSERERDVHRRLAVDRDRHAFTQPSCRSLLPHEACPPVGTKPNRHAIFSQILLLPGLGSTSASIRPEGCCGTTRRPPWHPWLVSASSQVRRPRAVSCDQGGDFGRKQLTVATATRAEGPRSGSGGRRGEQESSRRPRRPLPRSRRPER